MSKTLQDHHNDGQRDRAEGKSYNPPHDLLENALTWSRDRCNSNAEDNGAYRSGWKNTDDQKS